MSSVLRAACISFSSLELTILPIELFYPANSIPDNLNYEKGEEPRIAKKSKTADAVAVYNKDTGSFTPAYLEHIRNKGMDGSQSKNAVNQLADFLVGEQFRIFQILLQMSAPDTQSIGTTAIGFFRNLSLDGVEFHLGFVRLSLGFSLRSQKFLKGLFLSHIVISFLDKV